MRERLPDTRRGWTHKAVILWKGKRIKFYITANHYPDGRPGEVFLEFDQSGSLLDGWADSWSTSVSMLLQNQETLEALVNKFGRQRFDPQGMTENPKIPFVSSVPDYVMRWMEMQFGKAEPKKEEVVQ
jgi:ribonucleoside-diphosphate reductase alpha chain